MKRVFMAAGALLLGTSALAYAGTMDMGSAKPVDTTTAAKLASAGADDSLLSSWDKARVTSWEKTLATSKADLAMSDDSKFSFASLDKDLQPLAIDESGAKLMTASAETGWTDKTVVADAAFDKPFVADVGVDKTALADVGTDKIVTASADDVTDAKIETASVDKTAYTGMGGPLEEVTPASGAVVQPSNANPELDARGIPVISDPAYVPPGYNGVGGAVGGPDEAGNDESYPACTRERTDNCIQLYERGVHAQVADTSATTAMGGPYEPVVDDSALAMNGDGSVDAAKGETSDALVQTASADVTPTVADHSEYQGVGGPIEAQSGYPPCSPGPGDDRCIQLYEAGVTGAGN